MYKYKITLKLFDTFPKAECFHTGSDLLDIKERNDKYRVMIYPCHEKLEHNIMLVFERLRDDYRLHFKGDTYIKQELDSEHMQQLDMDYVGLKLDIGQEKNIAYVWKREPGKRRDKDLENLHFEFKYFYHLDEEQGDPIPRHLTEMFSLQRQFKLELTRIPDRRKWRKYCLCSCHFLHRRKTKCKKEAPWVQAVDQMLENNPEAQSFIVPSTSRERTSDSDSDSTSEDEPNPEDRGESPVPFWMQMEGIDY